MHDRKFDATNDSMTIRLSLTVLPAAALLLSACAANNPSPVTSAAVPVQVQKTDVIFASALQDLPERGAVEKLLVANEKANDVVTRRRDYQSAAGQTCTMLELVNKADTASSLVACRNAPGDSWNVRPAYGDMNVSTRMPPPSDPVKSVQTAEAAPAARHIIALQRPVLTQATIQPAMIEAPEQKAETGIIQYMDPVHMSPAPDTPPVAMPADWPTPGSLRQKAAPVKPALKPVTTPDTVLWQPRHSRSVTLSQSARPAPVDNKVSVHLAAASRSGL